MQAYDLLMLIVLGMAIIFGAIKGFAWQVASLASIVVSYIVAYRWRFDVAEMIQATPPWNQFLAMLILYVGTSFVIWVGFRLFSEMIDRVRLKEFDRHLGAAFGLAKGLIFCLLITMFAMSLLGPSQQQAICQSRSGYYISVALDRGVGILPKEIHEVVGPYLSGLDEKLSNHAGHDPSVGGDTLLPAEGGLRQWATEGLSGINLPLPGESGSTLPELPIPSLGSGGNGQSRGLGVESIFPSNPNGIFPPAQNSPQQPFPEQGGSTRSQAAFPSTQPNAGYGGQNPPFLTQPILPGNGQPGYQQQNYGQPNAASGTWSAQQFPPLPTAGASGSLRTAQGARLPSTQPATGQQPSGGVLPRY